MAPNTPPSRPALSNSSTSNIEEIRIGYLKHENDLHLIAKDQIAVPNRRRHSTSRLTSAFSCEGKRRQICVCKFGDALFRQLQRLVRHLSGPVLFEHGDRGFV